MKLFPMVAFFAITIAACNNQPANTAANNDTKKDSVAAPVFLPYTMEYSSWTMGDPQNLKVVLDMYKAWDDNKTDAAALAFGDSTIFDNATGSRAITTRETIADSLRTWRGAMETHSTEIISGLSLHSNDKNEDWVTVQSITRWTTKDGESDSVVSTDNWLIKNRKIAYLASFQQKPIVNP